MNCSNFFIKKKETYSPPCLTAKGESSSPPPFSPAPQHPCPFLMSSVFGGGGVRKKQQRRIPSAATPIPNTKGVFKARGGPGAPTSSHASQGKGVLLIPQPALAPDPLPAFTGCADAPPGTLLRCCASSTWSPSEQRPSSTHLVASTARPRLLIRIKGAAGICSSSSSTPCSNSKPRGILGVEVLCLCQVQSQHS